jgi:hypothetical protein
MLRNYRRLLVALGAALFAASPAALHAQQSGQPVRGDVDGDGQVTAADARIVSDFLVGRPVPGGVDIRLRADVNGDGRVTAADAAIIRAAAAGRNVSRFPVGQVLPDAALAVLECTGSVSRRTVECHSPGAPATGARTDILLGNQNVNVKLTSADVNSAGGIFQFTVTVQNLVNQAIGVDSLTGAPSADGVRVFFANGPVVTGGAGTIALANHSGVGTFTATNQPYFQYSGADLGGDGVLSPNETSSPRTWQLQYTGEVNFSFLLYVNAPVQFQYGWVDIYPPDHTPSPTAVYADTLQVGATLPLTDSVRNGHGKVISAPVTWSNTANGHATVSPTGVVTAVSPGVDTVIATAGPRTGRVEIVVAGPSADSTTITASPTSILPNDTSLITVQVRDEFGHNIPYGGAAVTLTTDLGTLVGATTGTTVNAVDNGNGTYTAKLTGTTAGTATVTGTLDGNPILDNATVTIGAGAMTHFVVEAAGGGNIPDQAVNVAFNVKVTARDAFNNTATSFTGTVGFTSTPGGGISAGAGPSAAFTAGVLSSHSITFGTTGDFTLTATRTGGSEVGTSNSFQVQSAPTAVNDGPTPTSSPGQPYHTAFNATFTLPSLGLMANDTRGFPLATVASFGADSLGGTVTSHAAGSTVSPLPDHADGSLTVNADGSVSFTPPTGFTGLYVFQYRISNARGTSDAQATIAVGVRPAVNNDTYSPTVLGNVPINTATSTNFNVTTNDAGDAKVLELGTATNGTVVLSPTGTFTFTPDVGYTGPASFTYTLKNGFGTVGPATVSMTVSGIAWFIDKGAAPGDGRFGTPFNDLSTAFAAATKPLANQSIFLYHDPTSYTGGVTLLAGQRLVGEGATGASFAAVMGVTWPADAGVQPTIGGTRPTVASGLTLGSGNTLQGFNLGGAGTLSGTSFGTLTVSEVGINTTGQALNLTTGTISGSFSTLHSSGGTNNVFLSGVGTSGTATLGASGDSLYGATGDGVVISNGGGSFTFPGTVSNGNSFAVNVSGKTGGTVTFSGNINPLAAGRGISVTNNNSGTNTIVFSGGTKSISSATAAGVVLTNNTGAAIQFTGGGLAIASTTGTPFSATGGGTVEVTGSGNTISATGAAANAVNLSGITLGAGGMQFGAISSSGTTTGSAFSATNVGNTSGSSFTAASLTVAATTGASSRGLALTTNSAPFTFTTASINNTGAEGIYLNGNTAAVSVNGGTVGNTTSTTGDALAVSGGNAAITVAASLTKSNAGRIANIASHTAGTVTVSGALSCTGSCTGILANANSGGTIDFSSATQTLTTGTNAAVSLTSNGGSTINFTGGNLAITTTSGAGFSATGGGTVTVQGANNTVNANGGGTAVNVSSTTIGASGMTWKRVDATGSGTNGIVLSSTGSGGFEVTGDGASDENNTTRGRTTAKSGGGTIALGSGGSISGRSGHGVSLATTGAVTLRNMAITGSASSGDGINASSTGRLTLDNLRITGHASDHGLLGTTVSGLAIHHSEIDNNGTTVGVVEGPDIWNVRLLGLTGVDSIRNSNIHHSQENVMGIINTSGVLNLTVLNTNITDTGTGAGGTSAFAVFANGNSNVTLNLQNDSINRGRSRGLQTSTETAASAVLNLTVNNSQFRTNGLAIENAHGSSGTNTFNITNNNVQAGAGSLQAININRLGSPSFNAFGLFTGTVSGNTIGTAGVANSGSDTGSGIEVESNGSGGITRVAVVNNTIREVAVHGIYVATVDANIGGTAPPLMEARVASNSISNMEAVIALDGIHVLPGALNTDDLTMCIDIANNNSTGIRNGLRVRPSGLPAAPSTVQLEGWDGVTAVNTYFTSRPNTLAGGTAAISTTAPPAPGGFVAAASCNTP